MLKRLALSILSSLLLFPVNGFCSTTTDNMLTDLDNQRNEVLKQITAQLVLGKVTPDDAQQLKDELDNTIKLESRAQEDKQVTPSELSDITNALDQVKSHLKSDTHTTKVWMGINSQDSGLQNKITNALATHKISKEQADGLMQEEESLRARKTNGSPTNEFEFTDAIALSRDLQTLDGKIDQLASTGQTQ